MALRAVEKIPSFPLRENLSRQNPYVLTLEPFIGEISCPLHLGLKKFEGLCFHPQGGCSYIDELRAIPEETFLILFQTEEGYIGLLCLSHADMTVSLQAGLHLLATSGQSRLANKKRPALIVLRSRSLYDLVDKLMQRALLETGNIGKTRQEKAPLPAAFETLGWHSNLAFGTEISQEKILQAVKSLKSCGFNLGFVLIEEGWQSLASHIKENPPLIDFGANKKRFPLGLKGLIAALKKENVSEVGAWHGIMGTRGGLDAKLAKYYDFPPDRLGRYFPGYDLGRTFQFFYDYYASLKEEGVTFVKVGDQESPRHYLRDGMDITRLHKNLQTAIQGASTLHFKVPAFHADALRNENLFYWTNASIAEASRRKASFGTTLSNALWLAPLMQPDFHAWRTVSDTAESQALLQALSGSPIAIADPPEKHDPLLLAKLVLPSGKILKTDLPLTLTQDTCFQDPQAPGHAYKAYTMKGRNGLLGIFNETRQKPLAVPLSARDIPPLKGERFVLYSYRHGFLGVLARPDSMLLPVEESDTVSFAPLEERIAVIGSPRLFVPPAPLVSCNLQEETLLITTSITTPLLLYCERPVLEIKRNGQTIPWTKDRRHLLTIDGKGALTEAPAHTTIAFE